MARPVSGGVSGRMAEELLPPAVLRQIGDKLYDKRKAAALEVEQIVKRLVAQNDHYRIRAIVDKARPAHPGLPANRALSAAPAGASMGSRSSRDRAQRAGVRSWCVLLLAWCTCSSPPSMPTPRSPTIARQGAQHHRLVQLLTALMAPDLWSAGGDLPARDAPAPPSRHLFRAALSL